MRALARTLSLNVPPVSTGTDKSCKLWTHWGVLLNVVPLSRAIANGAGHVVALHPQSCSREMFRWSHV